MPYLGRSGAANRYCHSGNGQLIHESEVLWTLSYSRYRSLATGGSIHRENRGEWLADLLKVRCLLRNNRYKMTGWGLEFSSRLTAAAAAGTCEVITDWVDAQYFWPRRAWKALEWRWWFLVWLCWWWMQRIFGGVILIIRRVCHSLMIHGAALFAHSKCEVEASNNINARQPVTGVVTTITWFGRPYLERWKAAQFSVFW